MDSEYLKKLGQYGLYALALLAVMVANALVLNYVGVTEKLPPPPAPPAEVEKAKVVHCGVCVP